MPLITLPKEAVDFEEAIKLLEEYPDDKPAYIRLNVLIKDYLAPDCNERASNAVKGKNCKFCYIKPNREKHTSDDETKHIYSGNAGNVPIGNSKTLFSGSRRKRNG